MSGNTQQPNLLETPFAVANTINLDDVTYEQIREIVGRDFGFAGSGQEVLMFLLQRCELMELQIKKLERKKR